MWSAWKSPLRWRIHPRMGLNPVEHVKLHSQLEITSCNGFESRSIKYSVIWTQLANAFSNRLETRSCLKERMKLSTDPAKNYIFEWIWIPSNLGGVCDTLHLSGKCSVEWVWNPFYRPLYMLERMKVSTDLAGSAGNCIFEGFESRLQKSQFQD